MCNHTSAYNGTEVACYRRPSGHWWVPPSVVLELTKREVDGGGYLPLFAWLAVWCGGLPQRRTNCPGRLAVPPLHANYPSVCKSIPQNPRAACVCASEYGIRIELRTSAINGVACHRPRERIVSGGNPTPLHTHTYMHVLLAGRVECCSQAPFSH